MLIELVYSIMQWHRFGKRVRQVGNRLLHSTAVFLNIGFVLELTCGSETPYGFGQGALGGSTTYLDPHRFVSTLVDLVTGAQCGDGWNEVVMACSK